MNLAIYQSWLQKKSAGIKSLAVLIDPDTSKLKHIIQRLELAEKYQVDYFFLGGSLILQDSLEHTVQLIRKHTNIPIILFPGNGFQLTEQADALLFMSLISGRNPEYLIGKQVEIAPKLLTSKLEIISTGYVLIDGASSNTASYMSHTMPIPRDRVDIALATSFAGQLMGFQCIYLDAGSGALETVNEIIIQKISKHINLPLIIGGGIKEAETAFQKYSVGADIVVVGNAIEEDPTLIYSLCKATKEFNRIKPKLETCED